MLLRACLILALFLAGVSAAHAQLHVVSTGPAPQAEVQRLVVHSDRIGRDFAVEITSPQLPILPGQKMPVIYALDLGMGIASPVGRLLGRSAAMRPAYIVSIGYLPGQELARNIDLVHRPFTNDGQTMGGGGAAFEAVLLDEIKPLLEARYPIDPNRSYLFGHSFGGLFAAEVFADRPDAFAGYLIASASAFADPTLPARLAEAARKAPAGRRVYVAWGEAEDPRTVQSGADVTRALRAGGPNLVLRSIAYPGENHTSYYTRVILDAFPWLLPKPPEHHAIAFDAALAPRYVGAYRLPDGRVATVTLKNGRTLWGQITGMPTIPLFPENRTDFFVKGFDVQVRFDASSGPAPGLTLSYGGVDAPAVRQP
jgi:predicted alpha/beta superfamily hydrolase